MPVIPRFARLFLLCLIVITVPTLYLLYSPSSIPHSPADPITGYEAGGIDSEHWRQPVGRPVYEDEVARDSDLFDQEEEERREMGLKMKADGAKTGFEIADQVLAGGVIMGKMENATAKAELGRAAWRVLHLMTLRFPDEPTPEDRQALKSYFHLFSRLYPCGECATEFQALLKEYPPQTSSRKVASLWLCHIHNLVNARLGKPEFDCLTLDSTYDCGCGDDPSHPASSTLRATSRTSTWDD